MLIIHYIHIMRKKQINLENVENDSGNYGMVKSTLGEIYKKTSKYRVKM